MPAQRGRLKRKEKEKRKKKKKRHGDEGGEKVERS